MYFIDVQGTLIDDDKKPIQGAIQFIKNLNKNRTPYIIVTNNTKQENFLKFLNKIGFEIQKNQYLDPLMILDFILDSKELLAFGVHQFLDILKKRDYQTSCKKPKTVLLGVKHDYSHLDYSEIIETLLQNPQAKLVGMHGTSIYSKENKRYVGVGAILEMIKFATGRNYQVIGKPSDIFYKKALNMLNGNDFKKITIISDDLKGDLVGAKNLGMKTILVLSGKIKNLDEVKQFSELEKPDKIIKNLSVI
jgi:NagD protein